MQWVPKLDNSAEDRSGGGRDEVHHGRRCGDQRASGSSGRDPSPASTRSEYTRQAGDSTADESEEGDDDEPSAVAEKDSAAAPPRLPQLRKRDTTPTAGVVGRTTLANASFNEAEGVGNIGWFFGNWGKRTQNAAGGVQRNIDDQIKKIHVKSSASANAKKRRRSY